MLSSFALEVGSGVFVDPYGQIPRADIKEDSEALTLYCHKQTENMIVTHRQAERFIEAGIPLPCFVRREGAIVNNLDCAPRNLLP